MKNLITLVIVIMTVSMTEVVAQNIYELDEAGNVIIQKEQETVPFNPKFESDVPDAIKTDQEILTQARKNGIAEVSSKQIKGRWEGFILWYVPKFQKEMLYFSQEDMTYSYNPSEIEEGDRKFSGFYLFGAFGMISMIIARTTKNRFAFISAFTNSTAAGFISISPFAAAITFASLFAVVFAMGNKKFFNFFVILYCLCIIGASAIEYYQI